MTLPDFVDPFGADRRRDGVLRADFAGEAIPMILGHRAVREAARDWATFSSDAPFRVPIPAESDVRQVRQLPIEVDPPLHTAVRNLVRPFFLRPTQPAYIARIDALIAELLESALDQPAAEIVRGFALPLQSRALTYLLGMPEVAADEWIGWGTHVFHDVDHEGDNGAEKGSTLDRYIRRTIAAAKAAPADDPGDDLFVAMTRMTLDGRPLTDDEMAGIANLTFAGGRDTILTAISVIIAWFADHREQLKELCANPRAIPAAVEEFVRVISPLTHIGRVCPQAAQVGPHAVAPDTRVSLCWASANYDERVFDDPARVRLDRSPNPHLGFGSGIHNCLGSAQARTILRSLIRQLGERTAVIEVLAANPNIETNASYRRWVGYRTLTVRLTRAV